MRKLDKIDLLLNTMIYIGYMVVALAFGSLVLEVVYGFTNPVR